MTDWREGMWNLVLKLLKASYFHYNNAYDHQTQQGDDLPWGIQAHIITWLFDHVVLRYHVTN